MAAIPYLCSMPGHLLLHLSNSKTESRPSTAQERAGSRAPPQGSLRRVSESPPELDFWQLLSKDGREKGMSRPKENVILWGVILAKKVDRGIRSSLGKHTRRKCLLLQSSVFQ